MNEEVKPTATTDDHVLTVQERKILIYTILVVIVLVVAATIYKVI